MQGNDFKMFFYGSRFTEEEWQEIVDEIERSDLSFGDVVGAVEARSRFYVRRARIGGRKGIVKAFKEYCKTVEFRRGFVMSKLRELAEKRAEGGFSRATHYRLLKYLDELNNDFKEHYLRCLKRSEVIK